MLEWTERTEMLLGKEGLKCLAEARVTVIGVGGVGAVASEMLARAGIGHMDLVDCDTVSVSNLNRQLIALHSTVGLSKCEVLKNRLLDINPDIEVGIYARFLSESNVPELVGRPDYVVDAIDTLSPKVALAQYCLSHSIPLVSSMGSGGKYDATQVRIADIGKTFECPLARMMRKRLHKLGIEKGYLAVFSPEKADKQGMVLEESRNKKSQVGTLSYMPAVFGCVCAQAVIAGITGRG